MYPSFADLDFAFILQHLCTKNLWQFPVQLSHQTWYQTRHFSSPLVSNFMAFKRNQRYIGTSFQRQKFSLAPEPWYKLAMAS